MEAVVAVGRGSGGTGTGGLVSEPLEVELSITRSVQGEGNKNRPVTMAKPGAAEYLIRPEACGGGGFELMQAIMDRSTRGYGLPLLSETAHKSALVRFQLF
ncbi:unnamed protein product [Boreogadus saida]